MGRTHDFGRDQYTPKPHILIQTSLTVYRTTEILQNQQENKDSVKVQQNHFLKQVKSQSKKLRKQVNNQNMKDNKDKQYGQGIQLSEYQRGYMQEMHDLKCTPGQIAEKLDIAHSTIYKYINNNFQTFQRKKKKPIMKKKDKKKIDGRAFIRVKEDIHLNDVKISEIYIVLCNYWI
ncbi:hypothetical protein ABPG72_019965 [Tetrahymena utriculariae]